MKIIKKFDLQLVKETAKKYDVPSKIISSPDDAHVLFNEVFNLKEQPREIFVMFALNTKNEIIGAFEVFKGSLNASIVHPREVFQRLLLSNAASFVVAHNHPSGNTTPSREDIEVTKRLKESGELLGIQLLDHLIVGTNYMSLKERGYL